MSEKQWASWDDELKEAVDAARLAAIDAQNELLFAAVEIGGIINMEFWAVEGMTAWIRNTGRQVRDLTVGQLLDMLKVQQTFHERIEEKLTTKWRRSDDQQG